MSATKLSLYNGALLECGERAIASLTEDREPRRLLDRAWDAGVVNFCLGQGQWRFATRTVQLAASTTIEPTFGYRKAYEIPDDHIRTTSLCSEEYMNTPLLRYTTEQNYFFTDVEPIFLGYVSNGAGYGGDFSLWPEDFIEYVHAYLASKIIKKLNQSGTDFEMLFKLTKQRLADARSSSAMEGPTTFPPTGSFVSARRGRGIRDRGNRGSLLG
jgi:hypothetical protein